MRNAEALGEVIASSVKAYADPALDVAFAELRAMAERSERYYQLLITKYVEFEQSISAIPAGKDGKDGRDGVDGAAGVDGRDGRDGKDGIHRAQPAGSVADHAGILARDRIA